MPERVHEIFKKERRAGHEHEQRHVRVVEAEGSPEQFNEKPERDQPRRRRASANTSQTGTFEENSDTIAPISARLVKPK